MKLLELVQRYSSLAIALSMTILLPAQGMSPYEQTQKDLAKAVQQWQRDVARDVWTSQAPLSGLETLIQQKKPLMLIEKAKNTRCAADYIASGHYNVTSKNTEIIGNRFDELFKLFPNIESSTQKQNQLRELLKDLQNKSKFDPIASIIVTIQACCDLHLKSNDDTINYALNTILHTPCLNTPHFKATREKLLSIVSLKTGKPLGQLTWICQKCQHMNLQTNAQCASCNNPKPSGATAPTPKTETTTKQELTLPALQRALLTLSSKFPTKESLPEVTKKQIYNECYKIDADFTQNSRFFYVIYADQPLTKVTELTYNGRGISRELLAKVYEIASTAQPVQPKTEEQLAEEQKNLATQIDRAIEIYRDNPDYHNQDFYTLISKDIEKITDVNEAQDLRKRLEDAKSDQTAF